MLSAPEQAEVVRLGRVVYQSRFARGTPSRTYLLRVVVDIDAAGNLVSLEILDASERIDSPQRIEYQVVPSGVSL